MWLGHRMTFIALVGWISLAQGLEIKTLSQAVDIAGKQRMYTQRMLKDYAMVGMGNTFGAPDKDLQATVQNFDDHLKQLIAFNQDKPTAESLAKVQSLWQPIKEQLAQPPTKDQAAQIQEKLEILLHQANEAVGFFAKQTKKTAGQIIDMSGRQRMLSQRMASLYMLRVWGIEDPKFKKKMDETMTLFRTSLEKLMHTKMNTPEILRLLQDAKRSFMFFEVMNRSHSKFIPSLIYKKSNDILKSMNTATGLYAAQEHQEGVTQ